MNCAWGELVVKLLVWHSLTMTPVAPWHPPRAHKQAEREQRIADEQAALGPSDKAVEEERLRELLAPLRLGVHEIRVRAGEQ